MTEYQVKWAVDVTAETPIQATLLAKALQSGSDTTATVFEVFTDNDRHAMSVDLDEFNPWLFVAEVRALVLADEVNGNDFYQAVGAMFDDANLGCSWTPST